MPAARLQGDEVAGVVRVPGQQLREQRPQLRPGHLARGGGGKEEEEGPRRGSSMGRTEEVGKVGVVQVAS